MMDRQLRSHPLQELEPVCGPQEVLQLHAAVSEVHVDVLVKQYIVALVDATREHPLVYLGASPRGSLSLQRLGQARALLDGRDYVLPDDIKALAYPSLGHRMILNAQARVKGLTAAEIVEECLERLPVPGVRARRP